MAKKIICSIKTPEKNVYDGEADHTVIEAHDGKRGFLINHTPFITTLGNGEVRIHNDDNVRSFYVEGGIVEMLDNRLSVLAENSYSKEQLNRDEINGKLISLVETSKGKDPLSDEGNRVQSELARLKARKMFISK